LPLYTRVIETIELPSVEIDWSPTHIESPAAAGKAAGR
jgi:hypothetical protein